MNFEITKFVTEPLTQNVCNGLTKAQLIEINRSKLAPLLIEMNLHITERLQCLTCVNLCIKHTNGLHVLELFATYSDIFAIVDNKNVGNLRRFSVCK